MHSSAGRQFRDFSAWTSVGDVSTTAIVSAFILSPYALLIGMQIIEIKSVSRLRCGSRFWIVSPQTCIYSNKTHWPPIKRCRRFTWTPQRDTPEAATLTGPPAVEDADGASPPLPPSRPLPRSLSLRGQSGLPAGLPVAGRQIHPVQ